MEGRPPGELPDDRAIVAAVGGDEAAFAVLVERYREVAFRAAFVVLGDADMAADAAQEGFINAHRALSRFRTGEPFRPWLLRIVGNRARNLRRAAARRSAMTLQAASFAELDRDAPVSPETAVADAEARQRVLDAVNALGDDDRAVIACRYFLELAEAETAALLRIRRGTVKSRLSRARDRLRVLLADEATEGSTDA